MGSPREYLCIKIINNTRVKKVLKNVIFPIFLFAFRNLQKTIAYAIVFADIENVNLSHLVRIWEKIAKRA